MKFSAVNWFYDHTIYYKSLHVDMILGIFVGYVTWLLTKKPGKKQTICYQIDYISDDEITGTLYEIINRTEKMNSLRLVEQYSL